MARQLTMSQLAALASAAAAKVDPQANKALRQFAQVGVGLVKKEIQNVHAVDTGTMLNSTVAESEGRDVIAIGPTVDYAVYVALGTSRMAARPFHITAARKMASQASDFGFSADDLGI